VTPLAELGVGPIPTRQRPPTKATPPNSGVTHARPLRTRNHRLALERATDAQEGVQDANVLIETVRTEMRQGFEKLTEAIKQLTAQNAELAVQNAKRSGAERLGAWLLGLLVAIAGIFATIFAALHGNTPHH